MADTDPTSTPEQKPPGAPRWVKTAGIVAAVVIVLGVIVMALAGGDHGPGRHVPGGDNGGGHTPPVEHAP